MDAITEKDFIAAFKTIALYCDCHKCSECPLGRKYDGDLNNGCILTEYPPSKLYVITECKYRILSEQELTQYEN